MGDVTIAHACALFNAAALPFVHVEEGAILTRSGVRVFTDRRVFEVAFDPGAHPLRGPAHLTDPVLAPATALVDTVRALEKLHTPFAAKWALNADACLETVRQILQPPSDEALAGLDASFKDLYDSVSDEAAGELRSVYEDELRNRFPPRETHVVLGEPGSPNEVGLDVDAWNFRASYRDVTVRSVFDLRALLCGDVPSSRGPGIAEAFLEMDLGASSIGVRINGFDDIEIVGTIFPSSGPRWVRAIFLRGSRGWTSRAGLLNEVSPPIEPAEAAGIEENISLALERTAALQFGRFVTIGLRQTDAWLERIRGQIRASSSDDRRRHLQQRERELFANRRAIEQAAATGVFQPLPAAPVAQPAQRRPRRRAT